MRLLLLVLALLVVPFAAAHDTPCEADGPGTVDICTPTSGASVTSPVRIIAVAGPTSGASITLMQIYVDGSKRYEIRAHDDVDTSLSMSTGTHRLTVQAKDSSGATFKKTLYFTVVSGSSGCTPGTTDPSVTICSPANNATVTSPFHVQAVTNSSSPVKYIQIYLDGTRVYHAYASSLDTSVSAAAGTHRLTVQAKNEAGTTFKKTIYVTVSSSGTAVPFKIVTYKSSLNFPVTVAFLPDGRLLYNELRTGKIRVIQNGTLRSDPWATLSVSSNAEQGLLGLAVDRSFGTNRYVYVFYSDPSGYNRVARFRDSGGYGVDKSIIIDRLPMALYHNGGNLVSGKDGRLYISIGDNTNAANSQSLSSKAGKILRYNRDGSIPSTNPFGSSNPVYALGLRNSFDVTVHPSTGTIYASENGPKCDDEINRIVAGGNYGWRPDYPCGDADPKYRQPIRRFNPVIAPTGIMFYTGTKFPQFTGSLFLVDYNEGKIRRYVVDENNQGKIVSSEVVYNGGKGALLDIVQGPDGTIYFSSYTAIYRIVPQ